MRPFLSNIQNQPSFEFLERSPELVANSRILIAHILEQCLRSSEKWPQELTIGLEQEFFLYSKEGNLITWDQSQQFLKRLCTLEGWRSYSRQSHTGETYITATKDHSRYRYTSIKYEYSPYMLEIAFSWFDDLNDLYDEIRRIFDDLLNVASALNIQIGNKPFCDIALAATKDSNKIQDQKRENADVSRSIYLTEKTGDAPNEIVSFPAYMASTQCHIGGLKWWLNPFIVARLNEIESAIAPYSSMLATESWEAARSIYNLRWSLYEQCFPDFYLIGLPKFREWTIENWTFALMLSPLTGAKSQFWAGKRIVDLEIGTYDIRSLSSYLRDFQSIRPRMIGTIEFRGDCAQNDPESLIAIAALRFGIACLAKNQPNISESLPVSFQRWESWRTACSFDTTLLNRILDDIATVFEKRKKNEGRFLKAVK